MWHWKLEFTLYGCKLCQSAYLIYQVTLYSQNKAVQFLSTYGHFPIFHALCIVQLQLSSIKTSFRHSVCVIKYLIQAILCSHKCQLSVLFMLLHFLCVWGKLSLLVCRITFVTYHINVQFNTVQVKIPIYNHILKPFVKIMLNSK